MTNTTAAEFSETEPQMVGPFTASDAAVFAKHEFLVLRVFENMAAQLWPHETEEDFENFKEAFFLGAQAILSVQRDALECSVEEHAVLVDGCKNELHAFCSDVLEAAK